MVVCYTSAKKFIVYTEKFPPSIPLSYLQLPISLAILESVPHLFTKYR